MLESSPLLPQSHAEMSKSGRGIEHVAHGRVVPNIESINALSEERLQHALTLGQRITDDYLLYGSSHLWTGRRRWYQLIYRKLRSLVDR